MKKKEIKDKNPEIIQIPVKWIFYFFMIFILVLLIFFVFKFGVRNDFVNEKEAEKNLREFLLDSEWVIDDIKIISSSKEGLFYKFVVDMDGENFPIYVTRDGKFLVIEPFRLK